MSSEPGSPLSSSMTESQLAELEASFRAPRASSFWQLNCSQDALSQTAHDTTDYTALAQERVARYVSQEDADITEAIMREVLHHLPPVGSKWLAKQILEHAQTDQQLYEFSDWLKGAVFATSKSASVSNTTES